jgi:YD repeat-containing protein
LFVGIQSIESQQYIDRNFEPSPLTPEAASLAKMVNYPINYNTGLPEIKIPLYEIKTGEMSLPIELTYHAGGFKINEQASRSGLGWSLSCDLQITRTINGGDDLNPEKRGYINHSTMTSKSTDDYDDDKSYPLNNNTDNYNLATGEYDGMPDKFYYKLMNKSGAFYFRRNSTAPSYTIIPYPYDNIKIEYDSSVFTITDTDGCKYYFGYPGTIDTGNLHQHGIETSGESSVSRSRMTWKCMRIKNANNTDSIVFSYGLKPEKLLKTYHDRIELWENIYSAVNPGPYYADDITLSSQTTYNESSFPYPFYKLASPKYKIFIGGGGSKLYLPYQNQASTYHKDFNITQSYINQSSTQLYGIKLNSITYRGGSVVFNENNGVLASITVTDNQEQKSINFYQSYAAPFPTDSTLARSSNGFDFLGTNYLDSVVMGDDRYTFRYYEKYCFGNHLIGSDFWGYVNKYTRPATSVNENELTIPLIRKPITTPKYSGSFAFGGTDIRREQPDEEYMRKGALSCIIYPTGGYVNFVFEANKYKDRTSYYKNGRNGGAESIVNNLRNAGGLRIRSITFYTGDSDAAASMKYYKYGDFEEGDGLVNNKPDIGKKSLTADWIYDSYSYSQNIKYAAYDNNNDIYPDGINTEDRKTTYLPFSALDNTHANGSPAYYTKVTEYQIKMGGETGKTVYEYYKGSDFFVEPERAMIQGTNIPQLRVDWHLGALKSVSDYKYVNGEYIKVHIKTMNYAKLPSTEAPCTLLKEAPRVVYLYPYTIYALVRPTSDNFGGTDFTYNGGNGKTVETYVSGQYALRPGKLLLKQENEVWIDDNNHQTTQQTAYMYDNLNMGMIQPSRIIRQSGNGTITTHLKYSYNFSGDGTLNALYQRNIISPVIEEIMINSNNNTEMNRTKVNYTIQNNRILRSGIMSSQTGASLTTDISFDEYDAYDNPVRATYRDGTVKTWIWGYNRRYVVAEVIGKSSTNIHTVLNMTEVNNPSSETVLKTELNKLYNLSVPEVMVNAYTYKPLSGILWHSDPRQTVTQYEYDTHGRLKIIRDHNGKILNEYTYFNRKVPVYWDDGAFTNMPVMETYSWMEDSLVRFYNYFRSGGQSQWGSDYGEGFTQYDYQQGQIYANNHFVLKSAENYVKIKFYRPSSAGALPDNMQFNFFREGSLVACKRMIGIWRYEDFFYMPSGKYTITWSMPVGHYDEYPARVYMGWEQNGQYSGTQEMNTLENIVLEQGKNYYFITDDY